MVATNKRGLDPNGKSLLVALRRSPFAVFSPAQQSLFMSLMHQNPRLCGSVGATSSRLAYLLHSKYNEDPFYLCFHKEKLNCRMYNAIPGVIIFYK